MLIGRFQVMALLQAARAYVLGLPIESAKSWGLNRAIFYAAAKRGFKGTSALTEEFKTAKERAGVEEEIDVFKLGDEMAFKEERGGRVYFTIGGKIQTERDFQLQVESRFGPAFHQAWEEAIKIVSQYDRNVLLSQRRFYERVYKPKRDELTERWRRIVVEAVMKAERKSLE